MAERGVLCWGLYHFGGGAVEGDLDGGEGILALVGHGLEGAGDSAVGLGVAEGSEAPGEAEGLVEVLGVEFIDPSAGSAQERLDAHRVRRHQRDQRLTPPRRRPGTTICVAHDPVR